MRSRIALLAALLLVGAARPAMPCGFDSGINSSSFSALHPKSLSVAFAVQDAVAAGAIEPAADPAVAGQAGYWRAVGHLTALQRALSAQDESGKPMSVLFIDSGLWARLTPLPHGFGMEVHTEGAKENDAVVVTNEPVLTAILQRRLAVADALQRGLIAVDGADAAAVERLLVRGLSPEGLAHAPPALQPAALFGPRPQAR